MAVKYSFSRNPLINRFEQMDPKIPIYFIFGENSWVKKSDGLKAAALRPDASKTFVKVIFLLLFLS